MVDYSRGKVPRRPRHDSSHKDGPSKYVGTLDTTGDIYASNNNSPLSTCRWPDWPLVTESSTWQGLTNTLT